MPDHLTDALRAIAGSSNSGTWIEIYREAGGGFEGLQAIAKAALAVEPEYDWLAVWVGMYDIKEMRIELLCLNKDHAKEVVNTRLTHPRCPSKKAWIERRPKVKQPPWEVVE